MGHRAGKDFFKSKRSWSRLKDQILASYLVPYLPKLATQNRPICIVDGFAGPGRFLDGEPGSPLLICDAVEAAQSYLKVPVKVLLIESAAAHATSLKSCVSKFKFAVARHGRFVEFVPEITELAKSHSIFLYLDPFAVAGLDFSALEAVFSALRSPTRSSIEVFLNFNTVAFVRCGRAILADIADASEDDDDASFGYSAADLDRVVGGDWWQAVLRNESDHTTAVREITQSFMTRLRRTFAEVCSFDVKESPGDDRPKYVLVFGSRHPDALKLMNDAMVRARDTQIGQEEQRAPSLFNVLPEPLAPDSSRLPHMIAALMDRRQTRESVVERFVRAHFACSRALTCAAAFPR